MMSEAKFVYDDLVIGRSRNGKNRYAVVGRTADMDYEDFSDSDDNEVSRGHVRVSWYPEGNTKTMHESKLQLIDRAELPGDVIRQKNDRQLGTVLDIDVFCDVTIVGTEKKISNVNADSLHHIYPFSSGDFISYGPWFGRIKQTLGCLVLHFSNGARGRLGLETDECEMLEDFYPHPSDDGSFADGECVFYPGQTLSGPAKAFRHIEWLDGHPPPKFKPKSRIKVLVEKLEIHSIKVYLGQRAFTSAIPAECEEKPASKDLPTSNNNVPEHKVSPKSKGFNNLKNDGASPPTEIQGEDLKNVRRLLHFWKGHINLGNRFLYKLTDDDVTSFRSQVKPVVKPKRPRKLFATRRVQRKMARIASAGFITGVTTQGRVKKKSASFALKEALDANETSSGGEVEDDQDEVNEQSTSTKAEGQSLSKLDATEEGGEEEEGGGEEGEDMEVHDADDRDENISQVEKQQFPQCFSCQIGDFRLDFVTVCNSGFAVMLENPKCSAKTLKDLRCNLTQQLSDMAPTQGGWNVAGHTQRQAVSKFLNFLKDFINEKDPAGAANLNISYEYNSGECTVSGCLDQSGKQVEMSFKSEDHNSHVTVTDGRGKLVNPTIASDEWKGETGAYCAKSLTCMRRQAGLKAEYKTGQFVTVEVCATRSVANIEWQNGETSRIPTIAVQPAHHIDDNDFCPGDFVQQDNQAREGDHYGIILRADSCSRMVVVQWFSFDATTDKVETLEKEELSVYEVVGHPDFTFRVSDFILRLCTLDKTETVDDYNKVGEMLRVTPDGKLVIHWSDDTEGTCYPQEVFLVDPDGDEYEGSSLDSDTSTSSGSASSLDSWETAESEEDITTETMIADLESRGEEIEEQRQLSPHRVYVVNHSGRLMDVISGAAGLGQSLETAAPTLKPNCINKTNSDPDSKKKSTSSTSSETDLVGGQFFMESSPPSHTFLSNWFQPKAMNVFMKAFNRDAKLLQTALPSGIHVKGYEENLNLLSVLFEGPINTPYENGLFVFDVQLPGGYPDNPPNIHYISYSPRLNPNLYIDGKVCISLLGTWMGKGNEMWTKDSNLLQVLVSIQGLILNSEPYYNEAGYEGHRGSMEGLINSRCYNEMVVLRMVQHMAGFVANPPLAFETLSRELCRRNLPRMLDRIQTLLDSYDQDDADDLVGVLPENKRASPAGPSNKLPNTKQSGGSEAAPEEDKPASTSNTDTIKNQFGFPLLPLSKGVKLALKSKLDQLNTAIGKSGLLE